MGVTVNRARVGVGGFTWSLRSATTAEGGEHAAEPSFWNPPGWRREVQPYLVGAAGTEGSSKKGARDSQQPFKRCPIPRDQLENLIKSSELCNFTVGGFPRKHLTSLMFQMWTLSSREKREELLIIVHLYHTCVHFTCI